MDFRFPGHKRTTLALHMRYSPNLITQDRPSHLKNNSVSNILNLKPWQKLADLHQNTRVDQKVLRLAPYLRIRNSTSDLFSLGSCR